jgi:type I restriction enzyme, S subunit
MTWNCVPLGELTNKIGSGATPRGGSTAYKDSGVPLIRSMNVHDGKFKIDGLAFLDEDQAASLNNVTLQKDDVLLNITGASVARVCILPEEYSGGRVNQHVAIIRPKAEKLYPKFLEHFLASPIAKSKLLTVAGSGATREAITKKDIEDFEIPLAPIEEQKQIAAILDQADSLRNARRQAIEKLNTLSQSIFYEMFGDPRTNSKKLPMDALGNLIKVSSGDGLTTSSQKGGVYPVYGGNGITGWHDEYNVPANTIIIGRVGVYCGAVHTTKSNAWVTDNALEVILKKHMNIFYLATALKYAHLNQYAGRSSQPLVSGARIYPVEIMVPSDDEQLKFEKALTKQKRQIEELEKHQTLLNDLFLSLQQRAFRGEL